MALKLKIVTPDRVTYDGEVESVLVPGTLGQFEILNNHAPIISSLVEGDVRYVHGGVSDTVHIVGGFVSVKKNEVNLCVEV